MNNELNKSNLQKTRFEHKYVELIPLSNAENSSGYKNIKMIDLIKYQNSSEDMISRYIREYTYNSRGDIIKSIHSNWQNIYPDNGVNEYKIETIYENIYDDSNYLSKKIAYRHMDNQKDSIKIHTYNIYEDDFGRLVTIIEEVSDVIEGQENVNCYNITTHYHYSNEETPITDIMNDNYDYELASFDSSPYVPWSTLCKQGRLIKKETASSFDSNEIHYYYYDRDGYLIEEKILVYNEVSHYYLYNMVDGKLMKKFASPVKGKSNWKLIFDYLNGNNCEIFINDSTLTSIMIKEIMEYIIATFNNRISSVIINVLDLNIDLDLDRTDYQYYLDQYDIRILENW